MKDRWMLTTCALLVALCAVGAAGCRKKRSTNVTIAGENDDIFTTDEFPGNSVQDNNVADDKRAMSPSGDSFVGGLRCTMNGDRGTCMVTYDTDNDGTIVHHFDGETWTPPVAIRVVDSSNSFVLSPSQIIHAFINTENHQSEFARDRDGDCLVIYRFQDTDPAGPDENACVYYTYFDASHHDNAGQNYGFEVYGTRINVLDGESEDVGTIAVVTDGLCGEARWLPGINEYKYGHPTESIEIVYRQAEDNDGLFPTADGDQIEDVALYSARIDLAVVLDADMPLPVASLTRLGVDGFAASDSGTDSEETQVMDELRSYNNVLLFQALSNDFRGLDEGFLSGVGFPALPAAGDDVTLQYVTYDLPTGTMTGATALTPAAVDSTTNFVGNNAMFLDTARQAIFGPDEGLALTVIWSLILVETTTGGASATNSARVALAEIDQADGSLGSVNLVNVDDPAGNEFIFDAGLLVEIGRCGDSMWCAYMSLSSTTGFFDLEAVQYVTTRPDEQGAFVLPPAADSISGELTIGVSTAGIGVNSFQFQQGLGYVCGAQSNADNMSIFFEQSDLMYDEIFQAELTSDLVLPTSPAVIVSSFEVFEQGDQSFANALPQGSAGFQATDSGFDGFIFAVYRKDVDDTSADDFRLFAERTGPFSAGAVEIDSKVDFRQVPSNALLPGVSLTCTPPGERIGRFDPVTLEDDDDRHHGNQRIHVLFLESRSTELSPNQALRTREFVTADNGNALGDNFLPDAGTAFVEPFAFDLPGLNPVGIPFIRGVARCDSRVGVWFEFQNRFYYQENGGGTDPGGAEDPESVGWLTTGVPGVSDPFLVDDDTNEPITSFSGFFASSCTCCDLQGAILFWVKNFGGSSFDRLQCRVRSRD